MQKSGRAPVLILASVAWSYSLSRLSHGIDADGNLQDATPLCSLHLGSVLILREVQDNLHMQNVNLHDASKIFTCELLVRLVCFVNWLFEILCTVLGCAVL